jgi:hypothetical protein
MEKVMFTYCMNAGRGLSPLHTDMQYILEEGALILPLGRSQMGCHGE